MPGQPFTFKTPARIRGTGRRQLQRLQRGAAWLTQRRQRRARMAKALCAVVRQPAQLRAACAQRGKIIHLWAADCRVQAALALAAVIHIPQPESTIEQPGTAPRIVLRPGLRLVRPQRLQQTPELVLRVRIVLLRDQRGLARKAAQHQQLRLRPDHRREPLQAQAGRAIRQGQAVGQGNRKKGRRSTSHGLHFDPKPNLRAAACCIDPLKSCTGPQLGKKDLMKAEDETKRWTAKRKSALVLEIIQGKTPVAEASRAYDLSPSDIGRLARQARGCARPAQPADCADQSCGRGVNGKNVGAGKANLVVELPENNHN